MKSDDVHVFIPSNEIVLKVEDALKTFGFKVTFDSCVCIFYDVNGNPHYHIQSEKDIMENLWLYSKIRRPRMIAYRNNTPLIVEIINGKRKERNIDCDYESLNLHYRQIHIDHVMKVIVYDRGISIEDIVDLEG